MGIRAETDKTQVSPQHTTIRHDQLDLNLVSSYHFFRLDPAFRQLSPDIRQSAMEAFITTVEQLQQENLQIFPYSTFGLREDSDLLFRTIAQDIHSTQDFVTQLYRTVLGQHLHQTHTLLAVTRDTETEVIGKAPYLCILPFFKTREWFLLPFPERVRMMQERLDIALEFPEVALHVAYSFGLDDQDFILTLEGYSVQTLVKLAMRLKETESGYYTLPETPSFMGIAKPLKAVLESLGI
jgi:chlorite dismutase